MSRQTNEHVRLWTFAAAIGDEPVWVLTDTGASKSCIRQSVADALALERCPAKPIKMETATGEVVTSVETVEVELSTRSGWTERIELRVLPVNTEFDVILGDNWFMRHEVGLAYRPKRLVMPGEVSIPVVTDRVEGRAQARQWARQRLHVLAKVEQPAVAELRRHELEFDGEEFDGEEFDGEELPADGMTFDDLLKTFPSLVNLALAMPKDWTVATHVRDRGELDHRIRTLFDLGTKHFHRKYSAEERQVIKEWVNGLVKTGVLVPCNSQYGAGLVLVRKPNGTWRICIDARQLNAITLRDYFPLPRIEELMTMLQGAKWMSSIDLKDGYHQVRLHPDDRHKTAMVTPFGTFQWTVTPFGLSTAPSTFMRLMTHVLREYIGKFVVVYLDDVLIFSGTVEEHVQHVWLVMNALHKHGLYLNTEKCRFFCKEITFLGYRITEAGRLPMLKKLERLKTWARPTTVSELRRFIGFVTFYQPIIKNFASIMAPLNDGIRAGGRPTLVWTDEQERAMQNIKDALATAKGVAIADPTQPFQLLTDASDRAVGAALQQWRNGAWVPVAFMSVKLSDTQRRYPAHERELLAVVTALDKFRYLLGLSTVEIKTDSKALESLASTPNLSDRMHRWAEAIARFDHIIRYAPGAENKVADALSRWPHSSQTATARAGSEERAGLPDDAEFLCRLAAVADGAPNDHTEFVSELQSATDADAEYRARKEKVEAALAAPTEEQRKWRLENGVLWRDGKLVLPESSDLRMRVLFAAHDELEHPGERAVLEYAQRWFWWKGMARDVHDYVSSCVVCQHNKAESRRPAGLLQPLPVPTERWEMVTMDFFDPTITCAATKCDYIFVVVDKFTKMAHFIRTKKTATGEQVAQLMCEHVVRAHGVPKSFVADRDPRWTNERFREFWSAMGARVRCSTAYHPQTDGQTEAVNKVLGRMMRCLPESQRREWGNWLWLCEFAYNSLVHSSTRYSPFYLNYGRQPRWQFESLIEQLRADEGGGQSLRQGLRQMEAALAAAYESMLVAQARQEFYANEERRDESFELGEQVLVATRNMRFGKLEPRYVGPFTIKRLIGPVAVELVVPEHWRVYPVFHISLLRKWRQSERFPAESRPVVANTAGGATDVEMEETRRVQPHRACKVVDVGRQ